MKQKEYEKWFKEKFGVEPLTDEEITDIKACLFEASNSVKCCSSNFYNRYMGAYLNKSLYEEVKEAERLVEQDAINLLIEKGYKVIMD